MSDYWIEKAQTAEAQVATLQQNNDSLKEEIRVMRDTFGIKGNSSGYSIDYAKLAAGLGADQCAELRKVLG